MSFLQQQKLLKSEWIGLERKINQNDLMVLKIVQNGYHDHNICHDFHNTISYLLKIDQNLDDSYIFNICFGKKFQKQCIKYNCKLFSDINTNTKKKNIKKSDSIRIDNTLKNQPEIIDHSIENLIINMVYKIIHPGDDEYFFVLSLKNVFLNNSHLKINRIIYEIAQKILTISYAKFDKSVVKYILKNAGKCIDNNKYNNILPIQLYNHQKTIYQIFKENKSPKLVYYTAPTSSGKTLTPIGLSEEYKIIFLCASKHIGLQLAKNLINLEKKIAFAFGCDDVSQIRLHNNAVSSYINTKYGKRIDNTDGQNVQIIISDIKSYETAMLYLLAYSKKENVVLFWDEPTIMMDKVTSEHHEIIKKVCQINKIPNIILSSATLPSRNQLIDMETSFLKTFDHDSKIFSVTNYDTMTNISLLDASGKMILPHTYFKNHDDLKLFLGKDIKKYYKFFSCQNCSKFILFYCKSKQIDMTNYFTNYDSLCNIKIKDVYFDILKSFDTNDWNSIFNTFDMTYNHTIDDVGTRITAEHSASLVHGPTLYICENTQNLMKYLYKISNINESLTKTLEDNIAHNESILEKINDQEKQIEYELSKKSNTNADNSSKDNTVYSLSENALEAHQQILDKLHKSLKAVTLPYVYIPNTKDHYIRYHPNKEYSKSDIFTCVLDESIVSSILKLDIDKIYKILLLQGIGVFSTFKPNNDYDTYESLVKQLADEKQLFVVIADSDYIFGVNYQFCHCFLGKDLVNVTHEKIIQAIGRVGRKERNKTFTFRFRAEDHVHEFFKGSTNESIEVFNMNKHFIF
jgi:hypothetical protein